MPNNKYKGYTPEEKKAAQRAQYLRRRPHTPITPLTPEERKESRKLARRKWAIKNREYLNSHKRERRVENEAIRARDHERYMRKIGHKKKRRVKKSPEELKAYKAEWLRKKGRRAALKRYGMTPSGYEAMLVAQNHSCAICAAPQYSGASKRRLSVDHCHDSGEVRGLLCGPCNAAIGLMKDDPKRLLSAVSYLHEHIGLKLKALIG